MSTEGCEEKLPPNFVQFTLFSRLCIVILQFIFHHAIPDHQADAFKSPYALTVSNFTISDSVTEFIFGGYSRWDAQYFLHIVTLGYTHENCLAFFPLFPILVRAQALTLQTVLNINLWNAALICCVFSNCIFFILAAKYLYLITLKLTKDKIFGFRTWVIFCLSPLTVFFTAPYSEALYCFLTFGGIYYCLEHQYLKASFLFGLSSIARSNGTMNVGFIGFYFLLLVSKSKLRNIPWLSMKFTLFIIISVAPFSYFQWYAYQEFCHVHSVHFSEVLKDFLVTENLVIPGAKIPQWCNQSLPLSYSAVQSAYWNVGFLRYFQLKQIPNFLIAAPMLFIVGHYSSTYVRAIFLSRAERKKFDNPLLGLKFLPFVVHTTVLALFSLLVAHVQISTRLLGSSSPTVYWIMSWLMETNIKDDVNWKILLKPWKLPGKTCGKLVYCYCVSYVIIGTLMFVNHLPWT